MAKINILDKNTIDKIAAGEVVDRPSSIVKELLENAIDAKATAITVEIKDGGISFIRITDNGTGIAKDDVRNAFLRHATSKIKSATDLLAINSLGFRGEALSSIAAVAQVECISKTPNELVGIRYCIDGGEEKTFEEVGAPAGTTFIVRNLFYNTPARRKFLKTPGTEGSYISTIIEKIALSHPDISIRFISNSQTKLHTSGNGKLKDIIYSIYGRDICSNVIEINEEALNIKITGFVGKPIVAKNNRNNMVYFINGRYIKSRIIYGAIEEAYKPFMMQHTYPFCVLNFEINPEMIDVNVHPSKMEIRFENQIDIYNLLHTSLSNAIRNINIIPEIVEAAKNDKKIEVKQNNNTENKYVTKAPEPFEIKRKQELNNIFKEINKEDNSVNKTVSKQVDYKVEKHNIVSETVDKYDAEKPQEIVDIKNNNVEKENKSEDINEQLELFDGKFLSKTEKVKHKMIGQLFNTYWLIEYNDSLYIVDQHAAHEKVLYEQTLKKFASKEFTTQQLNPPIILTLTLAEANLLEQYMDEFNNLGYEIESFGGREYAVRGVPDNLYSIGSEELLKSLIDNLSDELSGVKSDLITDKIASMSCKAAVKGRNKLSFEEADALIEQLLELDNPYNCPHGRPTIISMSKYELEKKFRRII
ncbi:MAG: DNA mismatch repair endonuclease MutL [Lachnospiraceae bacterium]|nr:DNA mismatch repair endonuclease MutL [Lachnospiraceae bacterium]